MFPSRKGLKQDGALLPPLFNFAVEYATRRVQVNSDDVKLSGTHQLLYCSPNSWGEKIEKHGMGGTCSMEGEKRYIQGFGGEEDHLGDPGIDGWILLRWNFKK
jgi:hypothetical protein